jgi:hypothetical protein
MPLEALEVHIFADKRKNAFDFLLWHQFVRIVCPFESKLVYFSEQSPIAGLDLVTKFNPYSVNDLGS